MKKGCKFEHLNQEKCVKKQNILKDIRDPLRVQGGIYSEADSSGDMYIFTKALFDVISANQNSFTSFFDSFASTINISTNGSSVTSVKIETKNGEQVIECDDIVFATGNHSVKFKEAETIQSYIYPVRGYVIKAPYLHSSNRLTMNMCDDVLKVYASPVGNYVHLSGVAQFEGEKHIGIKNEWDDCFDRLKNNACELLPADLLDFSKAQFRSCVRAQTPDDLPIVGKSPGFDNVWYNMGQGHMGWTRG
eukprot:CAMPEP_0174254632 /NCGR_PEP_ID=MMETSP0439-20130205/3959_1 /TAXON_ID=0 /ORGANISM="Stereomyxa ramosa, Strain Chinc5" /LENGTH=247 /DNA_ID=CAMNT_0015336343 /DNA_START=584 /DNA_END=1324 /DNA_ORIENTATION=+